MKTIIPSEKITSITLSAVLVCVSLLCGCNGPIGKLLPDVSVTVKTEDTEIVSAPAVPPVISINDDAESVITASEEEEEIVYEEIYDPVNKEYSVRTADPSQVTLAFVGDVGFAQGYATINKYRSNGSDIHNSMDEGVLSTMQGVDIMMANNEFPYSDRGTPTAGKTFTFRADPKDVHIMRDMGVDIVGLANNHAYDYGPDALIDTIDTLNDAQLPFVGAGKNIDEAMHPAYFHANGHIISIVAATQIERLGSPDTKEATADSPGVLRTLDPKKAVAAIKEAAEHSDFTVMFVHWGTESTDLVEQSQRDLARAYVDAGADLVIGAHSHCLQGIDYVDDVPVFYSLGNFWFNSKTLDTCIVRTTLDEECKLSKVEFIPCIQRGSCVVSATESEKSRIIEYMRGISNYAEIDDEGYVTKSDTDHNTQNGQNTSPARKPAEPAAEEAGEGAADAGEALQLPDWAVDPNSIE
ncbi:MAG: CapA family protein [Lachnospiraceae bacterium]|nr:CapA family protein [Lachnospiraceae bacterium]